MLKGPIGCGKTRFVERMAWDLGRPLITVACHEDMTAADLRRLLSADIPEARSGATARSRQRCGMTRSATCTRSSRRGRTPLSSSVPLTDNQRVPPLDREGKLAPAHPDFLLVVSYNPGYQSAVKDLKESTKQRFVAIDFDYPPAEAGAAIVAAESGVEPALAAGLKRRCGGAPLWSAAGQGGAGWVSHKVVQSGRSTPAALSHSG